MDLVRVTQVLKDEYQRMYPTEGPLEAGCRTKQCKQIKVDDKKANSWVMAVNQPICIEVDRSQASKLKLLLYKLFNKNPMAKDRPGRYNILFLPAEDQMQTGSDGANARQRALRKHKLVIQSLTLVKAQTEEIIQELDKPYQANGTSYTLRDIILDLPFPLVFDVETQYKLFNSVDVASKGEDARQGFVYFTTYKDRSDIAKGAVAALPAYVRHLLGDEAVKLWFASPEIGRDIDLGLTPDGHWDGSWTTQEDQILTDILDTDVGFQIDNMQLVDQDAEANDIADRTVFLTGDDASLHSFGGELYGRAGPPGEGGVAPTHPQTVRTGPDPPNGDEAVAHVRMSGGDSA